MWPDDPFDLSGLKALDADLSLSVVKLTIAGVEIGVPDLKAALKEGALALDAKNLAVEGAKITGTASVNVREALPKLSAKLKAQGVDPQAWFELFGQEARFVGKSTVEADLSGSGNSQRKLIDTLTGRVKAATSKGAIVGYDLNSFWGRAGGRLRGSTTPAGARPSTSWRPSLALTNGIAKKSSVEVTGSILGVNGNGVLRLPSQEIDYRARLTLLSWGQAAAVHILGGWTQPKVNYSVGPFGHCARLGAARPARALQGDRLEGPRACRPGGPGAEEGRREGRAVAADDRGAGGAEGAGGGGK